MKIKVKNLFSAGAKYSPVRCVVLFTLFLCSIGTVYAKAKFDKSNSIMYEVENGGLYGGEFASEEKGFSGEGYVQFPSYDQGTVEVQIAVPTAGEYCMFLHLMNKSEETDNDVTVPEKIKRFQLEQGEHIVASQRIPIENSFSDVLVNAVLTLAQGQNQFYLVSLQGEWQLDYVTLTPATEELKKQALPSRKLVNKRATAEAQNVFTYLCDMQGKGILSGQQIYSGQLEIKAIAETTGKYPAILGIDLIDYSPSRVAHGARSRIEREAISWWKAGGLVTCCWHWNAPLDLVDENVPNKHWYDGFRPEASTFDFATALNNPKSEEYLALIRDIDAIAVPLKKMQDEGVAVLWRPLHEASGGWFWWGASDAKPYIKLYRLLYDRLVNYHKLNNLIWVWNGQNAEWYPGDDVVDIISNDIYPDRHAYTAHEQELSDVRSSTTLPKLVAMSENGTLPNIDAVAEAKVPWSWFCTWNGEFTIDKTNKYTGKYTEEDAIKKFYENPYLITRDELPKFTDK